MRGKLAICAGLLLLGSIAGTAKAQAPYPGAAVSEAVLPPYEIMSIVRSTGLAPLTRPMRRGPYYVLVAVDRVGRQMRVVVDAQLGDIVNLRPAMAVAAYGPEIMRPYGPPPAGAPIPEPIAPPVSVVPRPGSDNALAPAAPAPRPTIPAHATADNRPASLPATPSGRPTSNPAQAPASPAMPATRTAVAEPPSPPPPPLPRPRPHLAANEAPPAAPAAPVAAPLQPSTPAKSAPAAAKEEQIE